MVETAIDIIKALTNGEIRVVPITQGKFAIVDAEDFERLSGQNWHLLYTARGMDRENIYAVRRNLKLYKYDKTERKVYMHREALKIDDVHSIDHKNHIGLDNRKSNLRPATRSQNKLNSVSRVGKSKYKGVYLHKASGKWAAQIKVNSEYSWLGLFDTEEDAALAYDKAALEKAGAFAYLNFPERAAGKVMESVL